MMIMIERETKKNGNLHLAAGHKLNGLLKSAVLYKEIDGGGGGGAKSVGMVPRSVAVGPPGLGAEVGSGM